MLLRAWFVAALVHAPVIAAARLSPLHVVDRDALGVLSFRTADETEGESDLRYRRFSGAQNELSASLVQDDVQPGPDGSWAKISFGNVDSSTPTVGARLSDAGGIELVSASPSDDLQSSGLIARGTYHDREDETGWNTLNMHISEKKDVSDNVKMYAAGVVEGYLTAKRVVQFYHNSRGLLDMNQDNDAKVPRLKRAMEPIVQQLKEHGTEEANGHDGQVRLALLQTWGIRDAAAMVSSEAPPSMVDMMILNADGVIDELLTAYGGGSDSETSLVQRGSTRGFRRGLRGRHNKNKRRRHRRTAGHCTGLVRLAENNAELYFGHTTWETFSEMTRIWKVYDFPLNNVNVRKISFSSYPGCVSSTDDYYLMDNGLAITETTLSIPEKQQYPSSPSEPDFARIMAVNRLANGAQNWVQSMADSATGTYSSQWMVMDYSKFTPRQELPDGAFYVLEQAPGASHYEDMSGWLRNKGYWASFDRAYFDEVRATTGDADMERQKQGNPEGELYTKGHTPRAQIIQQTVSGIGSLDSMREEMTRNAGTSEPVDEPTLQVPRFAISARDDLKDTDRIDDKGSPDGGVDAKVTSSCLFKQQTAQAISSPSHASLPPFRWTRADGTEVWPGYPHEGLPNEANFDWQSMTPQEDVMVPLDNGACQ